MPNRKYYRNLVREKNLANVAILESFSLDSGKIDFPIQKATIRMGLPIICFKGSHVDSPNKCALQSLNIAFIMENTVQTLVKHSKIPFRGFPV